MATKKKKDKKLAKKLLHKYRLVVLNEDTFEEKFTFKLTMLNVFVTTGISALILIIFTTLLIAFTPLREYIPGYSSAKLKNEATQLLLKTDSLQQVIHQKNQYFNSIRKVLNGEVLVENLEDDSIEINKETISAISLSPSKEDSLLRQQVEQEDKYNIVDGAIDKTDFKLFTPVKGQISEDYNPKENHFAVDIVTEKNTPVKAAAAGTVIFSEWTAETGNVIIIEHRYGLISVYKHNSSLTKGQGELVKKGEVIGMVGSTGELTTGPHLHFELWSNGRPVNPTDFLEFE
ncbi:Murein DD-endopeptidase MepM and murein hydrolase activator NlpD, contain LysM domain [Mesonia phycicola]|uniref:Murein DD-endopeptidase MepM and murein hydrolase activator NlpD, contain LysM domain n=1 Tax=Mesonia phycicola TaxID=579105 RepID=A0A1M6D2T5_9FLAO|nr:M23 family metallopeptidase [Mesonia phycicola]SHI67567.1 Murein DD-endopeptidase MepM and murein hydrolase activator NlpD, contain LysM domain [Mesonia phycicola]